MKYLLYAIVHIVVLSAIIAGYRVKILTAVHWNQDEFFSLLCEYDFIPQTSFIDYKCMSVVCYAQNKETQLRAMLSVDCSMHCKDDWFELAVDWFIKLMSVFFIDGTFHCTPWLVFYS